MPPIGPSPTNTLDVLLHQNPTIAANSCAMVATVYQAANLRTDIASKFVVFMLCAPDVSMMTFLDEEEIAAREHLRYQSSERHT